MKRLLILLMSTIILSWEVCAETHTEQVIIPFKITDFEFSTENDNSKRIFCTNDSYVYEETNAPAIPIMSYNYVIPSRCIYKSSTISVRKHLIASDCVLAANPIPIPTDGSATNPAKYATPYVLKNYPSSNCEFVQETNWKNASIFHFRTTPFIYDARMKNLYFIDQITLNITYEDSDSSNTNGIRNITKEMLCIANNQVDTTLLNNSLTPSYTYEQSDYDYIIITSSNLVEAFEPLVVWKNKKGVRAKVETIENIDNYYEGESLPIKIKNFIQQEYFEHKLQYVLLGGDNDIVPTFHAYTYVNGRKEETEGLIPCDIFYSTMFDKDPTWDKNGNGIPGELDDGLSLSPLVYVTRALVSTDSEVEIFVNKILNYEQHPKWKNNILMTGAESSHRSPSGKSLPDIHGNMLYSKVIYPLWSGTLSRFYDTSTSFTNGASYDLTSVNLQAQLSSGYSFIDMNCHGSINSWALEIGNYSSSLCKSLKNDYHSIILTDACHTNNFEDSSSTCLSRSFMNNPNNGVVAYWGSSREGWFVKEDTYYKGSRVFAESFYKYLFKESSFEKNYGKCCSIAKYDLVNHTRDYNVERWLSLSINPIGDPEVPIFTETPKQFNPHSIKTSIMSKFFFNEEGCRACVMSVEDNGNSYYKVYKDVNSLRLIDIPVECTLCITKQNFIPYICKIGPIQTSSPIIPHIESCSSDSNTALVRLTDVEDSEGLSLKISSMYGNPERNRIVENGESTVSFDISSLEEGIHIVSLYSGDEVLDAEQIIKR